MLHGQKCNCQIGNILHCMELLLGLYIHQYIFWRVFSSTSQCSFSGHHWRLLILYTNCIDQMKCMCTFFDPSRAYTPSSVAAMASYSVPGSGVRTGALHQILLHELCGISNWAVNERQKRQTGKHHNKDILDMLNIQVSREIWDETFLNSFFFFKASWSINLKSLGIF